MWYLIWILGTLLACAFGIITALMFERRDSNTKNKEQRE